MRAHRSDQGSSNKQGIGPDVKNVLLGGSTCRIWQAEPPNCCRGFVIISHISSYSFLRFCC